MVRGLVSLLPVFGSLQQIPTAASVDRLAVRLGRAIITEHPDIIPDVSGEVWSLVDSAQIGTRIREDFANGRTLLVQGWCLSRTEARVCALAALTAGDR